MAWVAQTLTTPFAGSAANSASSWSCDGWVPQPQLTGQYVADCGATTPTASNAAPSFHRWPARRETLREAGRVVVVEGVVVVVVDGAAVVDGADVAGAAVVDGAVVVGRAGVVVGAGPGAVVELVGAGAFTAGAGGWAFFAGRFLATTLALCGRAWDRRVAA
jgi:hypothetical protein